MRWIAFSLSCALLVAACWGRSGLDISAPAEGLDAGDASVDAVVDASFDDVATFDVATQDASPADASVRDAPCVCDDDGIACTHDICPQNHFCEHVPDDSLCPPGLRCSSLVGCDAFAYVTTTKDLLEVQLPSGASRTLANGFLFFGDLGLAPDGTLYAAYSLGQLEKVDRARGSISPFVDLGLPELTGLDVASDGTIYVSASSTVYRVALGTPGLLVHVADLPPPWKSSGDLAVFGGQILVSVKQGLGDTSDALVLVNPIAGTSLVLGTIGYRCVYGLAAFGPTLFGFTCEGRVITIDARTGTGTPVTSMPVSFTGATAR